MDTIANRHMRFLVWLTACALSASVIGDVRYKLAAGDLLSADAAAEEFCRTHAGTSECAAAISWLARGAEATKDYAKARRYLARTNELSGELLKKSRVEDDPFLATAVGAAFEVQARLLADEGKRDRAIALLRAELPKWTDWAIAARLRKNLNRLSLVGQRAPAVYPEMAGKPALLFLWGHWCGDCTAQESVMARIWERYRAKGLIMIAPTRRIGSVGEKDSVPAAEEDAEIDRVWKTNYSGLSEVPHPVDAEAMLKYGASSTPTIVLVDKGGVVRMYEPFRLSEAELRRRIDALLLGS